MAHQPDLLLARERAARRGEPETPTLFRIHGGGVVVERFDNLAALACAVVACVGGHKLRRPIRSVFSGPGFDTVDGVGLHTVDADDPRQDWFGCAGLAGRPLEALVAELENAGARFA